MLGENGAGVNFDKSLAYADEGGEKCFPHAKGIRGLKGAVAMGEGSVGDPITGFRFIGSTLLLLGVFGFIVRDSHDDLVMLEIYTRVWLIPCILSMPAVTSLSLNFNQQASETNIPLIYCTLQAKNHQNAQPKGHRGSSCCKTQRLIQDYLQVLYRCQSSAGLQS